MLYYVLTPAKRDTAGNWDSLTSAMLALLLRGWESLGRKNTKIGKEESKEMFYCAKYINMALILKKMYLKICTEMNLLLHTYLFLSKWIFKGKYCGYLNYINSNDLICYRQ